MATGSKEEFIQKFRNRTKKFSLDALKIFQLLPDNEAARIIGL
jgi:hypothetical protein